MNLLCLCPTYGRPKALLENTIACFLNQTHKDAFLLIYDDLGNVEPQRGERWLLASTNQRCAHLPEKYHKMIGFSEDLGMFPDGYVIWDDDDVYLPRHLEYHAMGLALPIAWSKSTFIWSTYTGKPVKENSGGRFHGSVAVRRDAFMGWRQDARADFDQYFMDELLQVYGAPADHEPQYVFRWGSTGANHCQALMTSPDNETWYANNKPSCTEKISNLVPELDADAANLYALLC